MTPESTGSPSPSTSTASPVALPALASKSVFFLKSHSDYFSTVCIEPWIGQGPPLQPHSRLVHLEEAQHPQPPSLPVNAFTVLFLLSSCFLHLPLMSMRSCRFMLAMDVCYHCIPLKMLQNLCAILCNLSLRLLENFKCVLCHGSILIDSIMFRYMGACTQVPQIVECSC